jgi:hypothetical protein
LYCMPPVKRTLCISYYAAPLLGSSRFALCLMNGAALLFLYLLRANISLTLVCMVRKPVVKATRQPMTFNVTPDASSDMYTSSSIAYDDATDSYGDMTTTSTWSNMTPTRSSHQASTVQPTSSVMLISANSLFDDLMPVEGFKPVEKFSARFDLLPRTLSSLYSLYCCTYRANSCGRARFKVTCSVRTSTGTW